VDALRKQFIIDGYPPKNEDPAQLEAAAFKQVNEAVAAILCDREFSNAFLRIGSDAPAHELP